MQKVLTSRSSFTWLNAHTMQFFQLAQALETSPDNLRKEEKDLRLFNMGHRVFFYWETNTTWYYVNSSRNVDSQKSESQMVIQSNPLTTEPLETLWRAIVKLWVSTGTASRGDTTTYLTHMNSLTASPCYIEASHMNSLTASRCHNKAYKDASNQPP